MTLQTSLTAQNLIGLVLARVEGGWQASVESHRGSYRDGPVADTADGAIAGALGPVVVPPPPIADFVIPPPPV